MSGDPLAEWRARMLATAEELADGLGWSVLPVYGIRADGRCSCPNPACKSPGKHPALTEWETRATSDLRTVLGWFGNGDIRNLGIHPRLSGLAPLDIDGNTGMATFQRAFGKAVSSPLVTRSGRLEPGYHLWFREPDTAVPYLKRGDLELRVGDHQTLAPPSRHASGQEYRLYRGSFLVDGRDLPELPQLVVEWALEGAPAIGEHSRIVVPDSLPDGKRRVYFLRFGSMLVDRGVNGDELYAMLDVVNQSRGNPPWEAEKLRTLVDDISKRYPATRDLAAEVSTWAAPVPLDVDAVAPSFPVDALPQHLATYCRAYAEATQTPVDAIATLVLGAYSTALQGRVRVYPRDGWEEQTCLFVLLVMESGTKKSPTFQAAFAPIRQVENELAVAMHSHHTAARGELDLATARVEREKRDAAKSPGADPKAYTEALLAVEAAERRVADTSPPVFYAQDATPEAFVDLLNVHKRMTIADAEGGWFGTFAGRYSDGRSNFDALLKGYGGEAIRVNRKGAPPIKIDNAVTGILVAVQRDVLREMSATPGAVDRGLLARFVKAAPPTRRGYRNVVDPKPLPAAVREEYAARLSLTLHELREHENVEVRLDEEAAEAFTAFRVRHEQESRPGGRVYEIGSWAEKCAGNIARIAAVLHFASADAPSDVIGTPIGGDTMRAAITIGDYFTEQELALDSVTRQPPELVAARRVLAWIIENGALTFTTRDLHRAKRGTGALQEAASVKGALALLAQHGYVRRLESERGEPGRPSEHWEANPLALREHGQNGQNPEERTASGDSVHGDSVHIVHVADKGKAA